MKPADEPGGFCRSSFGRALPTDAAPAAKLAEMCAGGYALTSGFQVRISVEEREASVEHDPGVLFAPSAALVSAVSGVRMELSKR